MPPCFAPCSFGSLARLRSSLSFKSKRAACEDEEIVRSFAHEVLTQNGYTVLVARHGHEALAISEQHTGPISLMVTDVVMPGMSGKELAVRFAPIRPDMRVLYISGYPEEAGIRPAALDNATAYLQKPFTPDVLTRKVRDVLDGPADQVATSSDPARTTMADANSFDVATKVDLQEVKNAIDQNTASDASPPAGYAASQGRSSYVVMEIPLDCGVGISSYKLRHRSQSTRSQVMRTPSMPSTATTSPGRSWRPRRSSGSPLIRTAPDSSTSLTWAPVGTASTSLSS